MNELTAYIDASQVYGSDFETAQSLRDQKANLGLLSVEPFVNSNGRPILPRAEEEEFCRSEDPENKPCFRAGDIRVNENQGRKISKTSKLCITSVETLLNLLSTAFKVLKYE